MDDKRRLGEIVADGLREFADQIDHGPRKQAERELGPFGCLCEDLHHRAAGDGCEICNPMPDLYGDEDDEQPTTKGRG